MDCSLPGSSIRGILQARMWGALPFPPPGDLRNPGIKPESPASPALQKNSLLLSHWGSLGEEFKVYPMNNRYARNFPAESQLSTQPKNSSQ